MKKENKKRNLQDMTDFKLMSLNEASKAVGWTRVGDQKFECCCGQEVKAIRAPNRGGVSAYKCKCGKLLVYMFSQYITNVFDTNRLNPNHFHIDGDEKGYPRYWVAEFSEMDGVYYKRTEEDFDYVDYDMWGPDDIRPYWVIHRDTIESEYNK